MLHRVQVTDTSQHQLFKGDSGLHGRIAAKKPLLKDPNNRRRLALAGDLFDTFHVHILLEYLWNAHCYIWCNPLTWLEFDSHDMTLLRISQRMLVKKDVSKTNPYCKLTRVMTTRVLTSDRTDIRFRLYMIAFSMCHIKRNKKESTPMVSHNLCPNDLQSRWRALELKRNDDTHKVPMHSLLVEIPSVKYGSSLQVSSQDPQQAQLSMQTALFRSNLYPMGTLTL